MDMMTKFLMVVALVAMALSLLLCLVVLAEWFGYVLSGWFPSLLWWIERLAVLICLLSISSYCAALVGKSDTD